MQSVDSMESLVNKVKHVIQYGYRTKDYIIMDDSVIIYSNCPDEVRENVENLSVTCYRTVDVGPYKNIRMYGAYTVGENISLISKHIAEYDGTHRHFIVYEKK